MMRGYKIFPFITPPAFPDYNLPPTLYRIMNSLANFDLDTNTDVDTQDKIKIKDLAITTRGQIFDFEYPLTENMTKEEFEVLILNHFLMRRIGYDTMNAFKIALCVKLNEIMPIYNKLFDALDGWDIFNDGEITTRSVSDAGTNSLSNTTTSTNTTTTNSTSDRRYSDTPQNNLQNVRDGKYITDYNFDTDTGSASDSGNVLSSTSGTDSRNTIENITRSPSDKIKIYKEFIENRKSILTMIFDDLDCLFYGLV
jgi:hypothetical protein